MPGAAWRRGLASGAWAGLLLGGLEAAERTWAHARHLEGAGELWGHALLTLTPVWLFCTLLGAGAGLLTEALQGLGRRLPSASPLVRRALVGALLGLLAGLWFLFSLTLTARLGSWLRLAPLFLSLAVVAGAAAGALSVHLRRAWRGPMTGGLLLGAAIAYFLNSRFAPQSSYGIHVLLDTTQWVAAVTAAALWMPAIGRRGVLAIGVTLVLCAIGMDVGFRSSPRLEALVKVRGVFARRSLDALRNVLDWDRDGFAPRFLVDGWDDAPFDPRRPEPLLVCQDGEGRTSRASAPAPALPPRPNLLLITIDACREDVLPGAASSNPLGAAAVETPHLRALWQRSAAFARCYSHASGTEDTFGSLFAGALLPSVLCGVDEDDYLAARLRRAGYRTRGWANGFPMPSRAWGWPAIDVREGETEAQIDSILAFLVAPADSSRDPAFAWFHFMDLHASVLKPWSPQAYDQTVQRRRYANGLRHVDAAIGRLVAGLEAQGSWDNTLLVVSADHGEELGEHGHYHHNLTLYEPAVRVPLWVAGWEVAAGPRPAIVPQIDLHATFLEAAGCEAVGSAGTSLLPTLRQAGAVPAARGVYLFLPTRGFSRSLADIRPEQGQAAWIDATGRYKTILRFDKETEEAYDVQVDPEERWNLAGSHPAWFEAGKDSLRRRLAAWQVGR